MMTAAFLWQTGGGAGILGSPLVMMIIVMGIFYVMLIVPQQRQRKKTQAMLAALKNGDKVVTSSGIYGTVNGIAHGARAIGDGVRHSQSGNTRSYAVWVVVGAIVVLAVIFFWPVASKTALGLVR